MECDNIETVKRAVEIDAGVAIVPQSTVVQEVANQSLVEIKFEDVEILRPLAVLYKAKTGLSSAMKQFIANPEGIGPGIAWSGRYFSPALGLPWWR